MLPLNSFRATYHLLAMFWIVPLSLLGQSSNSLSLDGTWDIVFDPMNEGREAHWMEAEVFETLPQKRAIEVPIAWETIEQDYEGVAFYQKHFEVPREWKNKVVRLQFDAVNYLSEVWLNDEVVGYHEGGFMPFEFRVDEMIKLGEENILTLRVVGPLFLSDKEIDGMKALETPQWRGGISGGIWQSVSLEASGDLYVKDVFIEPNIHTRSAHFHVKIDHTGIHDTVADISINIFFPENDQKPRTKQLHTQRLHSGVNSFTWEIPIPEVLLWSPDHPNLYRAEVQISTGGRPSDTWGGRFGMREFTIRDKDFYLNGKRIYLKAAFFEGLYPNGIANPDSKEMIRQEIQLAKEAGFNMIRPWRRPPVPLWLDLADEMGVLVVGSPALECMQLPFSTPYLPARVENEVRSAIIRDRNRPSIVQWELFNELHRPVLKQMMRPMAMLARDLDPTRLILDESGGWAFGANMYLPYHHEPTKFNDIHNYPGPFINHERYDGYLSIGMTEEEKESQGLKGPTPGRNVVPGLMSYVSELGYGSLPDLTQVNELFEEKGNPLTPAYRYHKRLHEGQKKILEESGFASLYPEMRQFYLDQQQIHGTANKRMIEAVRSNPEVDGYCIHALAAGDWILGAGLVDLWRRPKTYAYEGTQAANQAQIVSIRVSPRNVYAEKGAKLEIIGINDLAEQGAQLELRIVDSQKKELFQHRQEIQWHSGVSSLFEEALETKSWGGSYQVHVKVLGNDGHLITENSYPITVFKQENLSLPEVPVSLLGQHQQLKKYLQAGGISVSTFDNSTPQDLPVLLTGTLGKRAENPKDFPLLFEFVRKGGTAVYLEGADQLIEENDPRFPFTAMPHPAVGLWTCIPHLVHEHPIFQNLPVNGPMRDIYENVWARKTLRKLRMDSGEAIETVVGSLGFDWFSREHKFHYTGPGEAWWGSDVAILPMGKGKLVVSQLQLLPHLGKDPVADQILANLLRFTSDQP